MSHFTGNTLFLFLIHYCKKLVSQCCIHLRACLEFKKPDAIPDGLEFPMPYTFVYMSGIPKNTSLGVKVVSSYSEGRQLPKFRQRFSSTHSKFMEI